MLHLPGESIFSLFHLVLAREGEIAPIKTKIDMAPHRLQNGPRSALQCLSDVSRVWECTRRSAVAEGPRDALSVGILSTATQLYTKNRIQKVAITLKITRRHQKLRYSLDQISLPARGLAKFIFPANRQSYSAYGLSHGRCISVIVYAVN